MTVFAIFSWKICTAALLDQLRIGITTMPVSTNSLSQYQPSVRSGLWPQRRWKTRVRSFVRSLGADERSSITNSAAVSPAAPFLAHSRPDQSRASGARWARADRGPKGIASGRSVGRCRCLVVSCYRFSAESRDIFHRLVAGRALFSLSFGPSFFPSHARGCHIVLRTGFLSDS